MTWPPPLGRAGPALAGADLASQLPNASLLYVPDCHAERVCTSY